MKTSFSHLVTIVFFTMISFNCIVSKQNHSAYTVAFDYIKTINKDTPLVVIDTTVNLNMFGFDDDLSKMLKLKRTNVLGNLDSIDRKYNGHGAKIKGLSNLKNKAISEARTLYFSELIDTMLIAEIIPNRKITFLKGFKDQNKVNTLLYETQAYYNNSTKYLFIFDRQMHLKKVLTSKMMYN